jgi:hypothetical protein
MDLINHSDELKREADLIVAESNVVDILSKLGKVNFVGSYTFNLLYRQDIDIIVTSNNCSKDLAINTTKKFLDDGLFQTIGFANNIDYEAPNGLLGYYWELIFIKEGRKWKFDVWYTAEQKVKTIENTQKILTKLSDIKNAREKILELKHKFYNGEKYSNDMNGFKIYEQVLGEI